LSVYYKLKLVLLYVVFIFIGGNIFALSQEYVDIGYEAYHKRIEYLKNSMISQYKRYEQVMGDLISEVDKRNCISDRLVVSKSLLNFAEETLVRIGCFLDIDVCKGAQLVERSNQKGFMALLSQFNSVFAKYQKLFIEIDSCMLRYDAVVPEDGAFKVSIYKR